MAFEYLRSIRSGSEQSRQAVSVMLRSRLRRGCAWRAILAGTSSVALGLVANAALAQEIIDGGQTVTVPGDHNSPWNLGPVGLVVGQMGSGALFVQSGASVIADTVEIGEFASSNGTVTVSGANASLDAAGGLVRIGLEGTGLLTVEAGASLTSSGGLILGHFAGGDGTLRVTGDGTTWTTTQQVTVGSQGTGRVYLEDGATASHGGDLRVGFGTHQSGYVTISGSQTQWNATNNAFVGDAGNGDLQVRDGAGFDVAQDLVLGNGLTGNGTLVVNGAGSRATYGTLRAGVDGYGYIWVEDGGQLGSAGHDIVLGVAASGEAGMLATGAGTKITGRMMVLGEFGKGSLIASNGTVIETLDTSLGHEAGSSGSVNLAGANTYWHNSGNILVGNEGQGSIEAQNGARFESVNNAIGLGAGSDGSVFVRGSGTTWYANGILAVGIEGDGALTISDHAAVWALVGNGSVDVAANAGSTGVVNIGAAAGSQATAAGDLFASVLQFGAGDGRLVFNHTDANYTFATAVNGAGSIDLISGTTAFVTDSPLFSGTTTIGDGATLVANAVLAGDVSVLSGGTLAGAGSLGDVTLNTGSALSPGSGIATLSAANILFHPGSLYHVDVDGSGNNDLLASSGAATINGGTVSVTPHADFLLDTPYTILTATGGVAGTFTGATFGNSIFITPSLAYGANDVVLTLAQTTGFADVALTPNQKASAEGIQSLGGGNVFAAVAALGSVEAARDAYDQLSGEIHASAKSAMLEDSRFLRDAVGNRFRTAPSVADAGTGYGLNDKAIWSHGFGSWGRWNSDGNAARLDRSVGGFFIGADGMAFDTWRFGALAGYSRTDFDAKDRHSSGSSENYHLGLYGGAEWNGLAVHTGAAYTWHDASTGRSVSFAGFNDALAGDYDAGTAQVFGEVGYRMQVGNVALEPFANLAYVNLQTESFTEKGGAAALSHASSNTDAAFTTLGLRASTRLDVNNTAVTLKGMLGWRHAYGDVTPNASMRYAAGGNAFSIGGVPLARDAAIIEAGLDLALSPTATLGVAYGGQFGAGALDQSVKADLKVRF